MIGSFIFKPKINAIFPSNQTTVPTVDGYEIGFVFVDN